MVPVGRAMYACSVQPDHRGYTALLPGLVASEFGPTADHDPFKRGSDALIQLLPFVGGHDHTVFPDPEFLHVALDDVEAPALLRGFFGRCRVAVAQ